MSTKETGGRAFPCAEGEHTHAVFGMTLREWFAGNALVGLGVWCPPMQSGETVVEARARYAYETADAMLAARQSLAAPSTEDAR